MTNPAVAADIATGSVTARLRGFDYSSFAGSPDGKTVFFADSGAIWSMPIAGGERRRIGEGTTLAVDPAGRYLVAQVIGTDGVHLMHVPLDGGEPHRIAVRSDLSLAAVGLGVQWRGVGRSHSRRGRLPQLLVLARRHPGSEDRHARSRPAGGGLRHDARGMGRPVSGRDRGEGAGILPLAISP